MALPYMEIYRGLFVNVISLYYNQHNRKIYMSEHPRLKLYQLNWDSGHWQIFFFTYIISPIHNFIPWPCIYNILKKDSVSSEREKNVFNCLYLTIIWPGAILLFGSEKYSYVDPKIRHYYRPKKPGFTFYKHYDSWCFASIQAMSCSDIGTNTSLSLCNKNDSGTLVSRRSNVFMYTKGKITPNGSMNVYKRTTYFGK